jgi:coproporphyrinogen III oxidase
MEMDVRRVETYLKDLHAGLLSAFEKVDGRPFRRDAWEHREGGGGLTCVLENGRVFERACVSFSHVKGNSLPMAANMVHTAASGRPFQMMGTSCIMHPKNPYAPTVHMNVRFLVSPQANAEVVWWFGGGMDLTPYYGFAEDVLHFHSVCRDALALFGAELYPRFKKNCDEYFYNRHRREPRGVGGIFFDNLTEYGFEKCLSVTRSVGDHFLEAYSPIIERRHDASYGDREREFQAFRRGRYVEFNLTQDRGTRFGLELGGRVESIMASMPPAATWKYDWHPEKGSPEERFLNEFLTPKDWLASVKEVSGVSRENKSVDKREVPKES